MHVVEKIVVMTCFQDDSFRGVDMTEQLRLYHTVDGTFKGIIYSHDHTLVVPNFSVPKEFVLPDHRKLLQEQLSFPTRAFESVEGTLLRVFYFDGAWQVTTPSRLDAFASTWASSVSFGAQFNECIQYITGVSLDVFLCSLQTDRKYFFLLPTMGINRLGRVPAPDEGPCFFLVAVEDAHGFHYGDSLPRDETNAWSYLEAFTFPTLDALEEMVQARSAVSLYFTEVDARFGRDMVHVWRCVSRAYADRCALRNNEVNVLLRDLELHQEPVRRRAFRDMYPEVSFVALVDEPLRHVIRFLHQSYLARFIHREHTLLAKPMYQVLKKCHQRYLDTRERTTPSAIQAIVMAQPPKTILTLLKFFPMEDE